MNVSGEDYEAMLEKEKMYRQIVEYSVEAIIIHADHKVLYINQPGAYFLRAAREEIIGASVLGIFQIEDHPAIIARIREGLVSNQPGELIEKTIVRLDGTKVDVELNCNPVMFGDRKAIQSVLRDITKRKEVERQHQKMLKEINEISAPIVPVLEGIAVLPLVGSIDSDRARQLLDDLPSKAQQKNVHCLIIDLSGVYTFDELVIEYLFKVMDVLKLLGIRSILTGIRPDLAQAAIQLRTDLSSVKTMDTVKRALNDLGVKKWR